MYKLKITIIFKGYYLTMQFVKPFPNERIRFNICYYFTKHAINTHHCSIIEVFVMSCSIIYIETYLEIHNTNAISSSELETIELKKITKPLMPNILSNNTKTITK